MFWFLKVPTKCCVKRLSKRTSNLVRIRTWWYSFPRFGAPIISSAIACQYVPSSSTVSWRLGCCMKSVFSTTMLGALLESTPRRPIKQSFVKCDSTCCVNLFSPGYHSAHTVDCYHSAHAVDCIGRCQCGSSCSNFSLPFVFGPRLEAEYQLRFVINKLPGGPLLSSDLSRCVAVYSGV